MSFLPDERFADMRLLRPARFSREQSMVSQEPVRRGGFISFALRHVGSSNQRVLTFRSDRGCAAFSGFKALCKKVLPLICTKSYLSKKIEQLCPEQII